MNIKIFYCIFLNFVVLYNVDIKQIIEGCIAFVWLFKSIQT